MATVDEILATMTEVNVAGATNEVLVIEPNTRQINVPGSELIFGVEADGGSERKYFLCPRYVGDNLDLKSCFLRVNYRNANGEIDEYLVDDMAVSGDNITFSWVVAPKAVSYKGAVSFLICAIGPNLKVAWHTTLASGIVLEGLMPDNSHVESETSDVVAQLVAMVEAQTAAVKAEGATQIKAVQTAAEVAEAASVAEIEAKGVNTRASIPDDYTALSEAVDGLIRSRAGAIVCEAEGSAVVVNDASDNYIQGLRIFGRSTQDGTPTPDAPVEIVSVDEPVVTVCGKNLLPRIKNSSYSGITVAANEDGTVYINGTANEQFSLAIGNKMPNRYGGYILSGTPMGNGKSDYCLVVSYFTESGWLSEAYDTGKGVVIKDSSHAPYIRFSLLVRKGVTVNNALFEPMLSKDGGEYEPYSGQTINLTNTLPGIPVTSGGNYTDSDGQQWICDEVDLERGVYVQRVNALILDGSSDETWGQNHLDAFKRFVLNRNDIKIGSSRTPFVCSHFSADNIMVDRIGLCFVGTTSGQLYFYSPEGLNTWVEWTGWLSENPITVQYVLATPIETPLSETELAAYRALHSNKPNTTILNDAGAHMAVAYVADTKLYIDNKIAALVGG